MERESFQRVIHFSSSRATGWVVGHPFRQRILDHEALSDPDVCLAYPPRLYPSDALIPAADVGPVLKGMGQLRVAAENIYIRSASINTFNRIISLAFSCVGSHCVPHRESVDKDMAFRLGSAA